MERKNVKMLRRLAAAIAIAAFTQLASAQVLWQNFTAGMTLDEVRRASPNAELLPDDPGRKLQGGGMQKLRLPGIEIVGKQFEADFYFANDRLTNVHLVHRSGENVSTGRAIFNDLVTALRSKYGNELQRSGNANLGWSGDATWAAGGTTINLLAYLYDKSNFIQIGYSARLATEAGKL